ncbi:MAG TPA: class I SAM-dependent methyltransferase [Ktedonobacteraceae bacterium]|nr:class I SAM-dependent methyltransferase [Ktedonobacteraceae bacterium]
MPAHEWNTALYDQKHAFVFDYGKSVLSLLEAKPGELILDLGCGTGHLTNAIAESGAQTIGIDSAESMIKTAQETYPNREFFVADARDFSFEQPFDAIFSNAALHWVLEPEKVVIQMAAALKPGGRLVAEFGGKGNVAAITTALQQSIQELVQIEVPLTWYFPSIGEYASLLEKHGLAVHSALLFDRPTKLEEGENGLRNWLQMFGNSMMQAIPETAIPQVLERTEAKVRSRLFKDGAWFADYRRLRIVAYKE